ncbi:MAG: trypsin-like peptidase domain-containing protein [Deltaproteobacteria bacterium]|jgi:S1-C subfamily serine protease|nr:trypsin-like peptidase domain-containing protein [Deltaproteobacteria bacterium]
MSQNMVNNNSAQSVKLTNKPSYLVGLVLGLLLAGLILGVIYFFFYSQALYKSKVAQVDTLKFQSANIDTLKVEIERYRQLLSADVCVDPAAGGLIFPPQPVRRAQGSPPSAGGQGAPGQARPSPPSNNGFVPNDAPVAPTPGLNSVPPVSPDQQKSIDPNKPIDPNVPPDQNKSIDPNKSADPDSGPSPEPDSDKSPADPADEINPPQPEEAEKKSSAPNDEERAANLLDNIEAATVLVLAMDSKKNSGMSMGTGFFVSDDIVLTNRHVIDVAKKADGIILVTNKTLGHVQTAKLILSSRADALRDYAVLRVDLEDVTPPTPLKISNEAKRADRVTAWGYPGLITKIDPKMDALLDGDLSSAPELVYAEGVISVIQQMDGDMPLISHTAEVSQGNSGGPLIDRNGEVIGINTFIRIDNKSSRQVNVALGGRDMLSFLAENNIELD